MELMTEEKKGFKKTEVGLIPEDWEVSKLGYITDVKTGPFGSTLHKEDYVDYGTPIITVEHIGGSKITTQNLPTVSEFDYKRLKTYQLKQGDIVFSRVGSIDRNSYVTKKEEGWLFSGRLLRIRVIDDSLSPEYLSYYFDQHAFKERIREVAVGQTMPSLNTQILNNITISSPSTLEEQQAIASALSDVDELIRSLDRLIQKKEAIKKGTMQQLLTGQERLPGFDGEWEVKRLGDISDCLDNLRVPLNESQRNQMRGNIPYCGANGVLDYVDDYVVDDDIILMAEDGGYFDEYKTRPIAYRMKGKCWVNNHAHILKAKDFYYQSFLFYSLVNKDIQDYITGGTRAKLNKGSMLKIEVYSPNDVEEQKAIAQILSDMDRELQTLRQKREKYVQIKQGMMQELLTGKVRLV